MIDNLFRITLDPLFPPPFFRNEKKLVHDNYLDKNKFELVFDELEYEDIKK